MECFVSLMHLLLIFTTLLLSSNFINQCAATTTTETVLSSEPNSSLEFIKTSCKATIYPKLCYNSLSIYADNIKTDPKILALAALNVSLAATRSLSIVVKNLSKTHGLRRREIVAFKDCVEEVEDSVYELEKSIREMGRLERYTFLFQMSDIETWVSAALTDEDTCMAGFDEVGRTATDLVGMVQRHVVRATHLISNALALVNLYAT